MNKDNSHIIEVFKTNVLHLEDAKKILAGLLHSFPGHKINFDLEDCDKILRIQGDSIPTVKIEAHLAGLGYICEVLDE